MKKQTATRWYIGAWAAWALALCALSVMERAVSADTSPPGQSIAYIVVVLATIVMFVTWLAALFDLAHRRRWLLFAGVLLAQLLFIGVVGMLAYALVDRRTEPVDVVIRPAIT
jgi:bacteriorhodopsin